MIQIVLSQGVHPNTVEVRSSAVRSDTAAKPPIIVHNDQLAATLLCLLRASATPVSIS
jgi:hypothetical protein